MDTNTQALPPDTDLIKRVVAWHNRHWMSRRITPDQVNGIGVVGLPFAAKAEIGSVDQPTTAGRLAFVLQKAVAMLRPLAQQKTRQHLFGEDFIAPLKIAQIASFASQHGSVQRPGDSAWPQRDIPVTKADPNSSVELRFLQTAAIEVGKHRLRVLIGTDADPQIIGPRLWSRQRLSAGIATAGLLVLIAALPLVWPNTNPAEVSSAPAAAIVVMPVASAVQPPLVETASTGAIDPADHLTPKEESGTMASAAAAQASAAITTLAPEDAAEAKRQARQLEDASLTVSNLDKTPARQDLKQVGNKHAAPNPAIDSEQFYAVATEPTRSRMSSQLRIALLDLPTEPQVDSAHAEVMQIGGKWRGVIWPFADRESAESLRQNLAARGIAVEVINF